MAARNARRDSSGCLNPFSSRIRRYEAVLRPLLLWDSFAAMPRRAQELFAQQKFPDPALEFDNTFPADRQAQALRKTLEKRFAEAAVTIDDATVSVRDFFSVLVGLTAIIKGSINEPSWTPPCVAFMRQAGPLLEYWHQKHANATLTALHSAVIVPLVAHSRLDARMLTTNIQSLATPNGKSMIRMIVGSAPSHERTVSLDGAARPMVRVGTSNEWNGVRWAAWDEKPVYVQSHALRQLRERVNLPNMSAYLECWLHESLNDALVVDRWGADLLVEYRIHDDRLGYLVVTPLKDMVAVRTFLFLTMQQTPEARALNRRLRLTRHDVDWLGLSELAAFTETDLREDPVLRPLLEECGCGHLFALAEDGVGGFAPASKPLAAEMRRYLRMAA